jgi:hypothetical protein
MLLRIRFVFFDLERTPVFFFIDYAAMTLLWGAVAHCAKNFLLS